jgi:hypothetical protein
MDISATQGTVSAARDKVSNAAETAYRNVSRVAENTYAEAGQLANQAIEKVGNIGNKAQETYEQMLEERPWAIWYCGPGGRSRSRHGNSVHAV